MSRGPQGGLVGTTTTSGNPCKGETQRLELSSNHHFMAKLIHMFFDLLHMFSDCFRHDVSRPSCKAATASASLAGPEPRRKENHSTLKCSSLIKTCSRDHVVEGREREVEREAYERAPQPRPAFGTLPFGQRQPRVCLQPVPQSWRLEAPILWIPYLSLVAQVLPSGSEIVLERHFHRTKLQSLSERKTFHKTRAFWSPRSLGNCPKVLATLRGIYPYFPSICALPLSPQSFPWELVGSMYVCRVVLVSVERSCHSQSLHFGALAQEKDSPPSVRNYVWSSLQKLNIDKTMLTCGFMDSTCLAYLSYPHMFGQLVSTLVGSPPRQSGTKHQNLSAQFFCSLKRENPSMHL